MSTHIKELQAPAKLSGRRFFAWLLVWTSLLCLLGMAAGLAAEGSDKVAVLSVVGFPLVLCGAGAFHLFRSVNQRELKERMHFQEKVVLKVAASNGGNVTVAQIVCDTPLSSNQVEETMSRLCKEGIANPELLDDGTVFYRFNGLIFQNQ